jgi:hypothetical protein
LWLFTRNESYHLPTMSRFLGSKKYLENCVMPGEVISRIEVVLWLFKKNQHHLLVMPSPPLGHHHDANKSEPVPWKLKIDHWSCSWSEQSLIARSDLRKTFVVVYEEEELNATIRVALLLIS